MPDETTLYISVQKNFRIPVKCAWLKHSSTRLQVWVLSIKIPFIQKLVHGIQLYCTEKPGPKWTSFWKYSKEYGCVVHQHKLASISDSSLEGVVQDFHGPCGLVGRKTRVLNQGKSCFQLSFVLVFPFPRVCEAAELLYFSCVWVPIYLCWQWSRLGRGWI